ncbi:MAG TPA: HAMP domain-containing sensor histidine kinase [Candidatus Eremiobacteraceae bacterium]|nr:HAMP domain-containing sensor histidine kinase [Candidatus Eremiobacteraceae bacterium]
MRARYIPWACAALLIAAFAVDMFTPQLFVAAILLNAPVALTSFAFDRRLTVRVVVSALIANAIAGWYNGHRDQYFDTIAIEDRILAALSCILVGALSVGTQRAARGAAELEARQRQARRERTLREAFEAMRTSVNREIVLRAIARESTRVLQADAAVVFARRDGPSLDEQYLAESGVREVDIRQARPAPELASLLTRVMESGQAVLLDTSDAISRFALDTLGAVRGIAVPLGGKDNRQGVVIVLRRNPDEPFDSEAGDLALTFADEAAAAIAQSNLFLELAAKNEQLETANAAAIERSEVIRDIVYALSHDLRTPLSAARITMRQALDGAFGALPPAYVEILKRTTASNDELQRLAETLLIVARYEAGESSRARAPVELTALADDVISELRPLWQDGTVTVTRSGGDEPIEVLGDESELRRLMVNLLANAISSTPAGGHVDALLGRSEQEATIAIRDDGYGVPEAQRPMLFQRFSPGARHGAGSGLGLYIVRRIAESHGGRAAYEPRSPRGSSFTVTLPLMHAEHRSA